MSKNTLYLILALIFLSASAYGIFSLYRKPKLLDTSVIPTPTTNYSYDFNTVPQEPTIPSPSPSFQKYTGSTFTVTYGPNRKLIIENEPSGKRYVFYSSAGNITLHVGSKWSWQHPGRQLTPTFRYDTSTQTLIDLQKDDLNYTIQCVHGGSETLKSECDQFIANFQFTDQN